MVKERGLYNPAFEHDACGVGFIVRINGEQTHDIIEKGVEILCNLEHRGAVGGDQKTGDGAGMLFQIPHKFFDKVTDFKLPISPRKYAGMKAGLFSVGVMYRWMLNALAIWPGG